MIGHDDGVIDNQAEWNGDAGKRIELDFQFEQIIENGGNGQINKKTGGNQEQIAQATCHKQHEE